MKCISVFKEEARLYWKRFSVYALAALILAAFGIGVVVFNLRGGISNTEYAVSMAATAFLPYYPLQALFLHGRLKALSEREDIPRSSGILGLFLAAQTGLLVPVLLLHVTPLLLSSYGEIFLPGLFATLWTFFLAGAFFLALTFFMCAGEKKNYLAAILTLLGIAVFYFLGTLGLYLGTGASRLLSYLSPFDRLWTAAGGVLDISALAYLLGGTGLFLMLAAAQAGWADKKEKGQGKRRFRPLSWRAGVKKLLPPVCALLVMIIPHFFGGFSVLDTTSTGQLTFSPRMREILSGVDEPITVTWLCENGQEDPSFRAFLRKVEAENHLIRAVRVDPIAKSEWVKAHIQDNVYNNSFLVSCGDKSRYISYENLFENDYTRYSQIGTYELKLCLEDELAHAFSYVTGSAEIPVIYQEIGHGEDRLSAHFTGRIQEADVLLQEFSMQEGIPEDAAAIVIASPKEDFSKAEAEALLRYLEEGGHLFLTTDAVTPGENTLPTLLSVMERFGMERVEGLVVEGSAGAMYSQDSPHNFYVNILHHEVNERLIENRTNVLFSIAHALHQKEEVEGISALALLVTSTDSYSKAGGFQITTYDFEEGDLRGPLAISVVMEGRSEKPMKVVWTGSASVLQDAVNTESAYGNQNFVLGALDYLTDGALDALWEEPIESHLYNYGILNMETDEVSRMGLLFVGFIPLIFVLIGFVVWALQKRKKEAEMAAGPEISETPEEEEGERTFCGGIQPAEPETGEMSLTEKQNTKDNEASAEEGEE